MSLDENFTPENENAQQTEEVAETCENTVAEQADTEDVLKEESLENSEVTVDTVDTEEALADENQAPKKKKFVLQSSIIIACCIFLVAVLGFLCYKFVFMKSISDTVWRYDYSEDVILYYSFEEDNKIAMSFGSSSYIDEYMVSSNEDEEGNSKQVVSVSPNSGILAYNSPIAGSYYYEVTGNKLFGGLKLVLTSSDGTTVELVGSELPKLEYNTEDATHDDKLVGKWEYNDELSGQSASFTFYKDGMVDYELFYSYSGMELGSSCLKCAYSVVEVSADENAATADEASVSGTALDLTYFNSTNEEVTEQLQYSLDGDKLIIGGNAYTRAE